MIIDKNGNKNKKVVGVVLLDCDVMLADNQHFEESKTGKRITLFQESDGLFYKVHSWNTSSVIAYIENNTNI